MSITVNDQRWKEWCDEFIGSKQIRPMKPEESKAFIHLLIGEMQEADVPETVFKSLQVQVAKAHAARLGLKCSNHVLVLMAILAGDVGAVVMYMHALRRLQQITQDDIIKITTFSEAFPMGVPDAEAINVLWDKQKLSAEDRKTMKGIDNYLDYVVNQD